MWRIQFDGISVGGYVSLGVCDATRLNAPGFVQDCCILAYQDDDDDGDNGEQSSSVEAAAGSKRRASTVLEAFNFRIRQSVMVVVVLDPKSSTIEYFKGDVCIKHSQFYTRGGKMHPFVTLYQQGSTAEIL